MPIRLGSWVMAMVKPGAGLEADEDAVADQLDECAEAQHPGDHAQRGHRQAGEAGDLRVALRVAAGHRPPAIINEIAEVGPIASCREDPSSA